MTISKLPSLLCAFAVGALCLTVRAEDNPAQAAARMALAKQLFDLNGPDTTVPAASTNGNWSTVFTNATMTAPAAPAVKSDNDQKAAAERAALAAALASTNVPVQSSPAAKAAPVVQPPIAPPVAPATVNYPGRDLGMKQIAAPPLPISATKAERLQALLEKYKADQITPDEYHQQRAAILAEP